MTKFILLGGYLAKAKDGGKAFAEELTGNLTAPKILICLFARSQETWASTFEQEGESFKNYLPGRRVEVKLADPEHFLEQIDWADAIYIRGGSEETLFSNLRKCPGWETKLNSKTLAGSSAGADAISTYFYNLDTLKLSEGLGLLPIKVLVHYRSTYNEPNINWDQTEQSLKEYKEDLPLVTLQEGEFKVFEK